MPVAKAARTLTPDLNIPLTSPEKRRRDTGKRGYERSRAIKPRAVRLVSVASIRTPVDHILTAVLAAGDKGHLLAEVVALRAKFDTLTPSMRSIMVEMLAGSANKVIAHKMGHCQRTTENLRFTIMSLMGARTFAALMGMVFVVRIADMLAIRDESARPGVARVERCEYLHIAT
jgi:DNA-binding NarL/FixJ family response regulator